MDNNTENTVRTLLSLLLIWIHVYRLMGKKARRLYYVTIVRVRVSAHKHLYRSGPYRSSTPLPSGQIGLACAVFQYPYCPHLLAKI